MNTCEIAISSYQEKEIEKRINSKQSYLNGMPEPMLYKHKDASKQEIPENK